jgi:hypothetical protein
MILGCDQLVGPRAANNSDGSAGGYNRRNSCCNAKLNAPLAWDVEIDSLSRVVDHLASMLLLDSYCSEVQEEGMLLPSRQHMLRDIHAGRPIQKV